MPYSITYEHPGYIKLFYEGRADINLLDQVISQGVSLALEKSCFLVLSDFRKMELNLSVMSLFSIPGIQLAQSLRLDVPFYKFRRAVVVPGQQFEKYKFFETVAVNRSHLVKIFVDMEEAISWLLEK